MELVLSAAGGAGDAGSPFRNEDVREWSRVDRITGMLERARVETDRWQADTRDAKQSYGKMTDSRVRNSADGSLVQKARRQVEIFQSQGNAGRNFQVVRASHWSSSRATDCALDVASSPNNTRCTNDVEAMNGDATLSSARLSRLSLWRDTAVSDLDRLSYLCRKLHDEAMSNASFWPLNALSRRTPSPSLQTSHENGIDDRLSLSERRSNSNEDLSSLLSNGDETFTRDCKTRRSLQIPENAEDKAENKARRSRAELIAERAKRFEEGVTTMDNGLKRSFISARTFTPIANNDFVKNDPKHPSKFNRDQIAKISIQDNAQNGRHTMQVASSPQPAATRKANNKTVVHLRNAASPDAQLHPRCINVTAIKLEKDGEENGTSHNRPTDASAAATPVNGTKPVKKVEFCKTEIHFAADSGKVNIVETDGKPPPTNKFRRRRRNHSLNSAINTNSQKGNLPVVHFGDTSYEKYIFGGGKVAAQDENNKTDDSSPIADENSKNGWDSTGRDSKEIVTKIDSFTDTSLDKVMDHVGKFRPGAHTTTVNFLSDESKALAKAAEDKPSSGFCTAASSPANSQLLSKDSDQVLLKVVTTHKPIAARVEEHPSVKPSRLKNQTDEEKVKSHQTDDVQAKEHCDNPSDADDEPPVYENIFDAVSDGAPLYENFHQVVKATPPAVVVERADELLHKPSTIASRRKVAPKISGEASDKLRSVRSSTPKSEKDRSNSRSRDNSAKRRKEGKLAKDNATGGSQANKSSTSVQERKATPTNLITDKNTLKTKKPVEVVYKTAVYNMKNEKLSKPSTKSKEMKGPRLINELICGTKLKKPSDAKKTIKTIVSQSNSKRKETPSVVNR